MTDRSILDVRLAEIDRRLRAIQSGLAPVVDAPPPEPPAPPEPSEPPASPASPPPPSSAPPSPPSPAADFLAGPPAPAPPPLTDALASAEHLTEELRALRGEHEQVIAAARSLLSQLAEQLAQVDPAPGRSPGPPAGPVAAVTAGPFAEAAALRRFGEAIRALPGVAGVEVREFIGDDRAVLDVHLLPRNGERS